MDAQRKHLITIAAHAFGAMSLTDAELANAIDIAEEVLTFLEMRGHTWALATNALRRDLEELYGFRRAREQRQQQENRP